MGLRLLDPEPGYLGNRKGVSANEETAYFTDFDFFRKGFCKAKKTDSMELSKVLGGVRK